MDRIDLRCLIDENHQVVESDSPSGLLARSRATGVDFLKAISEPTLRELYRMIIARVRETGQPLTFTLRCDTAVYRRLSYVRVESRVWEGRQLVEVINGTTSEQRHAAPLTLLDPEVPRSPDLVTICSWCKQVRLPDGRWVEVEQAMHALQLFHQSVMPGLTHGMCQPCADAVVADLQRQLKANPPTGA